jgi:hypothetical protein
VPMSCSTAHCPLHRPATFKYPMYSLMRCVATQLRRSLRQTALSMKLQLAQFYCTQLQLYRCVHSWHSAYSGLAAPVNHCTTACMRRGLSRRCTMWELCAVVPCSDFIMYFNILTGKENLKSA